MKTVYLAGGIKGLTYMNSTNWRLSLAEQLYDVGIEALSPMRDTGHLANIAGPMDSRYEEHFLTTDSAIVTRDYYDVAKADAILVNVLGAEVASIGTAWEVGVAYALKKPIVLVMEKSNNIHDHPMINESARFGYRVDNYQDAIYALVTLLQPEIPQQTYVYTDADIVGSTVDWGEVFPDETSIPSR